MQFLRCARDIVDKNKKKIILYTLNAVSIGVHEISLTKTKNVYLLLYSSL